MDKYGDGNNLQTAFFQNKKFEIKNNQDDRKNYQNCSKLCQAYDYFAYNGGDSEKVKTIDCVCFNEYSMSII